MPGSQWLGEEQWRCKRTCKVKISRSWQLQIGYSSGRLRKQGWFWSFDSLKKTKLVHFCYTEFDVSTRNPIGNKKS